MEPEEDQQRNAHMRDYLPSQFSEVSLVHQDGLRLLHLERVDDPKRQVTQQQKRNQLPSGLGLDLMLRLGASSQAVHDEDRLQSSLHHANGGRGQGHQGNHVKWQQVAQRRYRQEDVEDADAEERDDQQHHVQLTFGSVVQEAQLLNPREPDDDYGAGEHQQHEFGAKEQDLADVVVVQFARKHEETADGYQRQNADEQAKEEALVCLVAADAKHLRRPALGDHALTDAAHVTIHLVEDGRSY